MKKEQSFGFQIMHQALNELGQRCPPQSEVIIVGGAAGVLCDWLDRATTDIDVIDATPRLVLMQSALAGVAETLGLPEHWLNDGAKAFVDVLPPDFRTRLVDLGQFGHLRVHAISRQDFILLKLYAFRDVDFEDLRLLQPTAHELDFVRRQLSRISTFDHKKAHYIELYLNQGENPGTGSTGDE